VEQSLEEASQATSRRDFLRTTALASAALMTGGLTRAAAAAVKGSSARIAVVGAGLAGLTAAYRLRQAGIIAQVFEANSRLGGRCYTSRGIFADNQIAEHGGELIDQDHTAIRQLAQELGLPLDNVHAAEVPGTTELYYFGGSSYSVAQATKDFTAIWQQLHSDSVACGFPITYKNYTPRAAQLDAMSVADWITRYVPGGLSSNFGKLLKVAYIGELGGEIETQSALNLITLMGANSPGQFTLFGKSNEKYHVRGGNDLIVSGLAALIPSQIQTGTALTAVKLNPSGTYTLSFQSGASVFSNTYDHVVFALPFSILSSSVDISQAGFSNLKKTAISQLPMGTNSKLNVQFTSRLWNSRGCNGETYADTGYQNTWDVSRGQAGKSGLLLDFTGGIVGNSFSTGTPATRAALFLQQLEPVLPGITQAWNGKATVDYWPGNPYSKGSYSYYLRGQYTGFCGIEGKQEGNAHFCGEHTSLIAQGYLEGAVETGQRAASEVVSNLLGK